MYMYVYIFLYTYIISLVTKRKSFILSPRLLNTLFFQQPIKTVPSQYGINTTQYLTLGILESLSNL